MAGLVSGAWSFQQGGGSTIKTYKSTVTIDSTINDGYTLKTPDTLDPSKPWSLLVIPAATADGTALPLDLWIGYNTDFALSGNDTTVAATDGALFKNIVDDVSAATARSIMFDPNAAQADVVAIATGGLRCKPPIARYYVFNLNGGSTLNSTTVDFIIMQSIK